MEKINWSNYNGEDFQRFCNSLLSMEVGKSFLPYLAPGKDGGVDGFFEGTYNDQEGKWRFQYKFHNVPGKQGFNYLKKDLKNEISNIKDEDHFVLVTNVELLPQYYQELTEIWKESTKNVRLEIWDGAKLFTLYLQFPILSLWLPDISQTAQLQDYKVAFKSNLEGTYEYAGTFNVPFISREGEVAKLKEFLLGDQRMVIVSGEAGIGKTRMVIEFFKTVVDNIDEWVPLVLLNRNIDFDKIRRALSGNKKYIILIDDAHEFSPEIIADMQKLSEIMNGKVKLILTARLLMAFTSLKLIKEYEKQRILPIKLDELTRIETKKLLSQELEGLYYSNFLDELTHISHGKPILIVAIIRAAKNNVRISDSKTEDFLKEYVANYFDSFYEVIIKESNTPKIKLQKLLQFICLIEPFNYSDNNIISKIAQATSIENDVVFLVLNKLKEGGFASGRYEQSIKPDYYSDMVLMAMDTSSISSHLADFIDFLGNIITNLSSVDEVTKNKNLLLDTILSIYIQNIKTSDALNATKILERVSTITYIKPDIAVSAVGLYLTTIEIEESPLKKDLKEYRNYHLQSAESATGRIKYILFELLYYPEHYEFVYNATYKLFKALGDSNVAAKVFEYAKRDYIDNYKLKRQNFFVSRFKEQLKDLSNDDLEFGLECCKMFLLHEFTSASSDIGNRNSLTITTYYLPNTTTVNNLRKRIIQLLIEIYNTSAEIALRKEVLEQLLDIPRGIFATTRNKTIYKGDDEIAIVLDFVISISNDLSASFHKTILDKIHWYRRWGISDSLYGRLDEIKKLLTPETLTEKLVHLFTRSELLFGTEAENEFKEKSRQLIAEHEPELLADSAIELNKDQPNGFHNFWSFLSIMSRDFFEKSQIVYSAILKQFPEFIYQYGAIFLQDFYFFHKNDDFYWKQIKLLQDANNADADNIILRVYSHRDFKADDLKENDIETVKKIAAKKDPKSNFDLARALLAVVEYDESLAKELCSSFLTRCTSREADIFFIFLSEEKMKLHYDLCKQLILNYSIRFPVGYEIERGLNNIILSDGINEVFNYFLKRFDIKKKSYEEKSDLLNYDWVPHGDHSHLFENSNGTEKQDFFMKSLNWYIELNEENIIMFFAKNLLDYAKPANSLSQPLVILYEQIANSVIHYNKKLERVLESLSIFHDKDITIVNLVLDIYNKAYSIFGQQAEVFKEIRYQSYSAITTMGVKSGTAGQPFEVDIKLKDLLKSELVNYQEYSPSFKFLNDLINSVEKVIQSSYDRENDTW